MKTTTAVDFLGKEMKAGDKVAFAQINYRNFLIGKITKVTPCMVALEFTKPGTTRIGKCHQDHSQVVKIPISEAHPSPPNKPTASTEPDRARKLESLILRLVSNSPEPVRLLKPWVDDHTEPFLCPTFYTTLSYEGDRKIEHSVWNFVSCIEDMKRVIGYEEENKKAME